MTKFSIITICYNSEEMIGKTVESVLRQTSREYEYIIVDGASTDDTLKVINDYKDPVMRIYSEPDRGISDAFNRGIAYSEGEYLLFLNSGDYFLSENVLEEVCGEISGCSEEVITFSIRSIMKDCLPDSESAGKRLWEESLIPHQGSFIRRDVFAKVGMFNPYFKIRMDYDFFSRCYIQGISFKCIPRLIVYYDSGGISATDEYNARREGLAVRLLYGMDVQKSEMKVIQYLAGCEAIAASEMQKEFEKQRKLADKHYKIMMVMNKWIHVLQSGRNSSQYFFKKGIFRVGIYGWGYLGKCLANELQGTDIKVEYVIDQNKKGKTSGMEIYDWEDIWPEIDVIVVTPFYEFPSIKQRIKCKMKCRVISIEDVITEI